MIVGCHYYPTECDVCKAKPSYAYPTFEQQIEKLLSEQWVICSNGSEVICPKCAAAFQRMVSLLNLRTIPMELGGQPAVEVRQ